MDLHVSHLEAVCGGTFALIHFCQSFKETKPAASFANGYIYLVNSYYFSGSSVSSYCDFHVTCRKSVMLLSQLFDPFAPSYDTNIVLNTFGF
jgi:hypothetical protein